MRPIKIECRIRIFLPLFLIKTAIKKCNYLRIFRHLPRNRTNLRPPIAGRIRDPKKAGLVFDPIGIKFVNSTNSYAFSVLSQLSACLKTR